MAYALILDSGAVEIVPGHGFTDANGVQHPADWHETWSPQKKTALGLRVVAEPAPAAADERVTGTEVKIVNGSPVRVNVVEAVPLADLKAAKLEAIRARRRVAENAGVTVGGVRVRTDETTQAKITGALMLFQLNDKLVSLDWEATPSAFVTLDQPTLQAIGLAIGAHVQACFTRSRELSEAVTAARDLAALDAVDVSTGWPE
ncbi:MAG: DUF4376 domain-containing protein [Hyphomonadaceae bacterium]|nr:DUF4376 domain-containing protein [Hyphomonadaceae bacterium]